MIKETNRLIRLRLMVLSFAVIAIPSVALAQVTTTSGKVTLKQADGTVMVNDQPANLNSDIASESTITTAKGSSAVVSLGKLGRLELKPNTKVKLSFTDSSLTAMLDSGRVRVSSSVGTTATVKTADGEIVANPGRATEFTVDLTCGDTLVSTQSGKVELRAGNAVKQIAAGSQDTAGQARPGCKR